MNRNDKVLKRSDDKVLAGVCGGLAEYFGWEPKKTRIGYVLLSVLSAAFPGTIVYLVLWLCMPDADERANGELDLEDSRQQ